MWMHPSGDIYNAHDSHLFWAGHNIEGAREHKNGAVEGALGKGYARLANMSGYIAAEHRGLSPKQQGAMEELANATGKGITDDRGHTIAEPSMAEAAFQAPKAEDFKDETKLADALKQPGWALFTATQESKGAGTDKVNVEANDQLEKELRDAGFDPIEVKGNYKGVDQGKNFIVPGMTQEQATEQ
jgi:hypothetical protein